MGEVEARRVGTAVVGPHAAVSGVDRHHRGAHLGHLAIQVGRGRIDRGVLGLRVDGCGDLQPLGVQGVLIDVEQLEKFAGDLPLDQTVRAGGEVFRLGLVRRHRLRENLLRTFGFG